ncbi:MAG: c-type cytochrome [Chitinophagaceae bacterium]|nr:c-type cytochrome [Chitinophagaceae bacterium]MCB9046685.1 c-type cytochrome [Chitinophagales bacterium]
MKKITVSLALLATVLVIACNKNKQSATSKPNAEVYLDLSDTTGHYFDSKNFGGGFIGGGLNIPYPSELDKMAILGRVLFYDGHLSLNNAISCGSCHKQAYAFADNASFSMGFEGRMTGRNTPPIQNLGKNLGIISDPKFKLVSNTQSLFWDGRENNLEALVIRPVANHVEMGMADINDLPAKLNSLPYYKGLVQDAYHTDELTLDMIKESISYFMMALSADNSRFVQFERGEAELTAQEQIGMQLFNDKYNCASCHIPDGNYGGERPRNNIGLDAVSKDKGVGAITLNPQQDGDFVIPKLTNVALTAPYMHDGRFSTLDSVLEHYSKGIKDNPNLDDRLRDQDGHPMRMNISTDDRKALIAFLNTLTDHSITTNPKYSNPFKIK